MKAGGDVAISERTDLFGHVQRRAGEVVASTPSVVAFPLAMTVHIEAGPPGWQVERLRARAETAFVRMEKALAAGRFRKAKTRRGAWMHAVHLDRLSWARALARENALRLDPMGRGPVP